MSRKKIVVLSGAGISAESGLSTFRDAGGLWEGYDVYEVASPGGWIKDPEVVLRFYNERRRQLHNVKPNEAHIALAQLESKYDVVIVTQNVDNLHERAGSSNIIHLHGELTKARSTVPPYNVYDIGYRDINLGDECEKGSQLRPDIVWFGEAVPLMTDAATVAASADILIVVGTSLVVYPAAGLIDYVSRETKKYIIDPHKPNVSGIHKNLEFIVEKATTGTPPLVKKLLAS
ncbi:MAG: NAD-dependent deacylase [Ignavibacteria bacterium]|nr:NAD-dependent deacylase [Ignavibacteria bacterium]